MVIQKNEKRFCVKVNQCSVLQYISSKDEHTMDGPLVTIVQHAVLPHQCFAVIAHLAGDCGGGPSMTFCDKIMFFVNAVNLQILPRQQALCFEDH